MTKLICMDPEGNYHGECNKSDKPCCMCTKPRVAVKQETLLQWVKLLHQSGENTKTRVSGEILSLLQSIKKE